MQDKNNLKPSVRYANRGFQFGSIVGIVAGLLYAISPTNPNRGNFLSFNQNLIIFGTTFGFCLIGLGIGYALGKWAEGKGHNQG